MIDATLILLASGYSKRFHGNKLLTDFHGKPLIEYAYDKAKLFKHVLVVTQYDEIIKQCEYPCIKNKHPEYGQGYSIALGVQACQTTSCMLMVCDMPYIQESTIQKMFSIYDGEHIVIGKYKDILCNPMILPQKYYSKAKQLKNDKGAKQLLDDQYMFVNMQEKEFIDIDSRYNL